ncbi:uncharacterized protein LOC129217320 [Uloborus diversus]|uniref:uncharacterized protein LOC129217320 n=1 Tax=Uloborus diversus TaxID=327109 RepID=UPI002409A2DE|nr:uncharacterized protein LOC129217320 [Uloborus diversus]
MATSVTARLHIMFKAVLVQIYDLYKKLFPWLTKLKKGSWEWPSSLALPNDLEEWLKPEHFDNLSKNSEASESQINALANYFAKKKANERDKPDVIDLDSEKDVNIINCDIQQLDEDIGEVVIPEKTSVENQHRKFTSSQKSILRKIYKAKTLEKLQTVWDNINAASEDLYPFMLTQKKINKINKLLDSVGNSADNKYCASGKSKVPIMQNIRFRFTKYLGLVKNQEEYFHFAEEFSQKKKDVIKFKPVKKIKELKQIHEEMCRHMNDASEYEKLEKLSKYYEGQYAALKELKKSGDLELTKKLTYYASKVLIRMFNGQ